MTQKPDNSPVTTDPKWAQLQAKYPNHPALAEETVYSLPPPLIDAICRNAPKIFTSNDEEFEYDLHEAAPFGGFFRQQAFTYPPLESNLPAPKHLDEVGKKIARSAANIREMLSEHMQSRNASAEEIKQHFDYPAQIRQEIEERRWGYAGWLATSTSFLTECDRLRAWKSANADEATLPQLLLSINGQSQLEGEPSEYEYMSLHFLRKWGIERMISWELPIPMKPELAEPNFYSPQDINGAGLTIFVPWYLLRDKNINLHDIAEQQRLVDLPKELDEWYDAEKTNWGYKRYTQMLKLFVYLEFGIYRRYPDKMSGNTEKLDIALGEYLLPDPKRKECAQDETIRKTRQEMLRRMKKYYSFNAEGSAST